MTTFLNCAVETVKKKWEWYRLQEVEEENYHYDAVYREYNGVYLVVPSHIYDTQQKAVHCIQAGLQTLSFFNLVTKQVKLVESHRNEEW